MKQGIKFAFASTVLLLLLTVSFKALPNYTDGYINDIAGILSQETKNYVFSSSKTLDEKTTAQVAVATVPSLEGMPVEEYAILLFRQWGIGGKEKNNGLLILLAPNERKVRIEVCYGLEGKINDAKAGQFIDEYAVPYFKDNKWDEGIKMVYSAVLSEVYSEYGMEVPENIESNVSQHRDEEFSEPWNMIITIVVIVIVIILSGSLLPLLFGRRFRRNYRGDGGSTWWSGGGGFGGGSGGGGFGGFGGGSSGGGGASGSF